MIMCGSLQGNIGAPPHMRRFPVRKTILIPFDVEHGPAALSQQCRRPMQQRRSYTEHATGKQNCSAEHTLWLGKPRLNVHHVTKAQVTSKATATAQ
jgi:hypothetical protein